MIKVDNLQKTYPGKVPTPALKGLSFSVADGEFVAVMGRSGSGKSTLLHQLGLIDTPTAGQIWIGSTDVTRLSASQKTRYRLEHLGYVFQEYALIVEFTVLENVYLPALALGKKPEEYKSRAAELLGLVGLGQRLDHYPHEISGGEQQRVAIARALINRPAILFADEPTANLDTVSAKTVLELFKKLNDELKQTIVMVTHEPDDQRYVHRVVWLQDGLIEKEEATRKRKR
ncbi:ABC transporter ATP-binding protein [Patescibacteria group bacterium]|nr:ABC transporter ATP-binding protein [Patescibacteria group bacterium]MCL5091518.1 ABC transporter ATP-binding protein [Patescibacteria group bacterium]